MTESPDPDILYEDSLLIEDSDQPSLPPILQNEPQLWEDFPWSKFRGYIKATRPGNLSSWIWRFGYDIEEASMPDRKK